MAKFPGDLESQYALQFSKVIKNINREYMKVLRQLLAEDEGFQRVNGLTSHRYNAFEFRKFKKKLLKLRVKLAKSLIFRNIFESMEGVFARVETTVKKGILKSFDDSSFPLPELALNAPSEALKESVERNVELIGAIADKHTQDLEDAVMAAVTGGANFDTVVEEVQKQSDRGLAYAEFVAKDQVAKVYADINKEKQQATGFDYYEWSATEDERTRPTHAAQDGKVFSWKKAPLVGGRNLHPGEDYNCRCIAIPRLAA